jgi:hypothetical protein
MELAALTHWRPHRAVVRVGFLNNVPSQVRTVVVPEVPSARRWDVRRFWAVLINFGPFQRRYAPKTHLDPRFQARYGTLFKLSVGSGIEGVVSNPVQPIRTVHSKHPGDRPGDSPTGMRSLSKQTLDFEEINLTSQADTEFKECTPSSRHWHPKPCSSTLNPIPKT